MSSPGSRNVRRGASLERRVARFLGGQRFWVGSGERVDVESQDFIIQTKKVKKLPLAELVRLAEEMEGWAGTVRMDAWGRCWSSKVGMVAVELARGAGQRSPTLYVMTQAQMFKLFNKMNYNPDGGLP